MHETKLYALFSYVFKMFVILLHNEGGSEVGAPIEIVSLALQTFSEVVLVKCAKRYYTLEL